MLDGLSFRLIADGWRNQAITLIDRRGSQRRTFREWAQFGHKTKGHPLKVPLSY